MLTDPRSGSEVCQPLDRNCIGDEVSTLPLLRTRQVHVFPQNREWVVGLPEVVSSLRSRAALRSARKTGLLRWVQPLDLLLEERDRVNSFKEDHRHADSMLPRISSWRSRVHFVGGHDIEHQATVQKTAHRSIRTCVVHEAEVSQPITEHRVIGVVRYHDHVYIIC
jgi:hypothetical protein